MSNSIAAIFVGDYRLADDPIKKIKSMFIGDDGEFVSASSLDEIEIELTTPSMLGKNRIISIPGESFSEELCELFKRVSSYPFCGCMAICRIDSITSKCMSIIKKAPENSIRVMILGELNGFDSAINFVEKRVAKIGCRIDGDAIYELLSTVGINSASDLISEIDKLDLISNGYITKDIVTEYAYRVNTYKFFDLYKFLSNGDYASSVEEIKNHAMTFGAESVDMAISKLISTCCRLRTGLSGTVDSVHINELNSHWWKDGKQDKINSFPSKFMQECATKILNRIGDGVQSLMRESSSDMISHRKKGFQYPIDRLYMKALVICFGGNKSEFDIIHWNRPITNGDCNLCNR